MEDLPIFFFMAGVQKRRVGPAILHPCWRLDLDFVYHSISIRPFFRFFLVALWIWNVRKGCDSLVIEGHSKAGAMQYSQGTEGWLFNTRTQELVAVLTTASPWVLPIASLSVEESHTGQHGNVLLLGMLKCPCLSDTHKSVSELYWTAVTTTGSLWFPLV